MPGATLIRVLRSRPVKRVAAVLFAAGTAAITAFTVRHFVHTGWPLADANAPLVAGAGALFLVAFALKGAAWRRMFVRGEQPRAHACAAANAAASVTGVALPGRFDDVVRVAVVRRFRGGRAGLGAIALSIVAVGLIDSAALTPMASVAAGATQVPASIRAGLALVALAGIGAALIVVAMPRLSRTRLVRFRIVSWLGRHAACTREASKAWALVSVSWSLRALAVYVLLMALGVSNSFALALLFLTASAASAALPVGPGGAATQAGAGAAALALAGVGTSEAIAFAIAAQALLVMAGAAVVVLAGAWEAHLRFAHR